jgi:hypothetical protein
MKEKKRIGIVPGLTPLAVRRPIRSDQVRVHARSTPPRPPPRTWSMPHRRHSGERGRHIHTTLLQPRSSWHTPEHAAEPHLHSSITCLHGATAIGDDAVGAVLIPPRLADHPHQVSFLSSLIFGCHHDRLLQVVLPS